MKLYEINYDIEQLWYELELIVAGEQLQDEGKSEDQLLDEIENQLAQHEEARDKKALNIACLVKNWQAEAEAIKAEKLRLQKRQQVRERAIERIKNYLAQLIPDEKISDARAQISWRKSQAVKLDCEPESLPRDYTRIKIEPATSRIKKA